MTDTAALALKPLGRKHLFHLIIARNWLAMGNLEEARREFEMLPRYARSHPQAQDVRERLEQALS